jgi:hypothetical protein
VSCARALLTGAACSLLALACEPERPREDEPEQVLVVRSEDGPLTLSVRTVSSDAWSGRVVVASYAQRGREVRVVPSEAPRSLDGIVGPIGARQPFAAIDGGFYDLSGAPMGLVRSAGRDVAPLRETGGSGVFLLEHGAPRIVHRDAYRASDDVTDAVQSIDRLVSGGRSLVSADASDRRAARSAIALDGGGTLHLVVAFDERAVAEEEAARIVLDEDSGTTGPTIGEMAQILVDLGARDALGMDGGFSTSLTVKSTQRSLRIEAYRATINAVLVSAAPR